MRISSIRVLNYKSFRDSGQIVLSPGFNVVVGKNDAGKTALVEALSLTFVSKPHRSFAAAPTPRTPVSPISTTELVLTLTPDDIREAIQHADTLWLPLINDDANESLHQFNRICDDGGDVVSHWFNNEMQRSWLVAYGETPPQYVLSVQNTAFPGGVNLVTQGGRGQNQGSVSDVVARSCRPSIYAFRAERMNVGECQANGNSVLLSNAANLADVMNQLISANPARYEKLMIHVRTIFPHITQITAPISGNSIARVLVWSAPIESERADLAVPLAESGTGIGQILAILYVVVTADSSRVIVIDEPQSFLHPGAVRKLMEILRSYSQHQYVITTHAPIALATADEDCLLLARRVDQETVVERIDQRNEEDLRTFLAEVGARLGDVFGADSILWVEGKTEETCFPELIRRLAKKPLLGTQVLGVVSTDELTAKMATRVFDIYKRLAGGTSLLPPALAFLFDMEGRTERERDDLDRLSGGLLSWLPRRMYENYLLEPAAICAVFNDEDAMRPERLTPDEVHCWLEREGAKSRYHQQLQTVQYGTDAWCKSVHGGLLLQDFFGELSDQRIRYDKVRHGLMLTRFLIEQPTAAIRELATMLAKFVPS